MKLYSTLNHMDYRFEVKVPTTIFDPEFAVIEVYKNPEYKSKKLIDKVYFPIKKMPKWDVPAQAIFLSKSDERTLMKKTRELITKLNCD